MKNVRQSNINIYKRVCYGKTSVDSGTDYISGWFSEVIPEDFNDENIDILSLKEFGIDDLHTKFARDYISGSLNCVEKMDREINRSSLMI